MFASLVDLKARLKEVFILQNLSQYFLSCFLYNSWRLFKIDINDVKTVLQKNNFPSRLNDQNISSYLNDKYSANTKESGQESTSRYFTLTYI